MPISRTAGRRIAVQQRILGLSALSLSNSNSSLTCHARFVCTAKADRIRASSGLPTDVCAGTSFELCRGRDSDCSLRRGLPSNSSPKRCEGTETGLRRPQEGSEVHVFSKPAAQLSAAQLAHFTHLRGLLRRLPSLRQATSNTVEFSSTAAAPHCLVSHEGESGSQLFQTRTTMESVGSLHSELFVVSRVITSPHHNALPAKRDAGVCGDEVFTGVNHAFHKRVNPAGVTLRGILKGCAEQNALGAAAASGCIYADVADVFLLAASCSPRTSYHVLELDKSATTPASEACHSCVTACGEAGPPAAQAVAIFPCPECWRHLCHVARARLHDGRTPLRLFVHSVSPAATVRLFAVAQQRMTVMQAPMDVCIVSG
ncbi:hypothetical protein, conserved [Leishmania tarentolae]|uniref:Uncharacterized protein n=1 Tax=Leishmania tarentolae TaxID=5689 RepID=A0A640KLX5_LEITA|nr:hypothetical protein, conserved [Leishmania tarentolae]